LATILVQRSEERGTTDFGWLQSQHTFSFGDNNDPACMGFRSLKAINDERVASADGAGAVEPGLYSMVAASAAEALLFDL
jgi:redox-sensitive bicupin YhaK (pirin superfamily)